MNPSLIAQHLKFSGSYLLTGIHAHRNYTKNDDSKEDDVNGHILHEYANANGLNVLMLYITDGHFQDTKDCEEHVDEGDKCDD